jgi:hypothetical protein
MGGTGLILKATGRRPVAVENGAGASRSDVRSVRAGKPRAVSAPPVAKPGSPFRKRSLCQTRSLW